LTQRIGNFDLASLSKRSASQVLALGASIGGQLILAQSGESHERNVALLLTNTELIVTGSAVRRIPLDAIAAVEPDNVVMRDGTRIPWNPYGGQTPQDRMMAAISEATGLDSPVPQGEAPAATPPSSTDVVRAIHGQSIQQTRLLESIQWTLIGIGVLMILFFCAILFGWIRIVVYS
jgi:hypothetical protein